MKVTVLYNIVSRVEYGGSEDVLAEQDTIKTAKAILETLSKAGYGSELFLVDPTSVKKLKLWTTDLFFNNAFGIGNVAKSEADLAAMLEKIEKPFSGAKAKNIILTTDKTATKKLLMSLNLPTPNFQVFGDHQKLDPDLRFPLLVKPTGEDSSLGITQSSVVTNKNNLYKKVKEIKKLYQEPALVEEYIDGRELSVSIIGNGDKAVVLPISEIIFGPKFPGKYKIVDFDSKWKEGSDSFTQTVGYCPAKLKGETRKKIEEISLEAYRATGCQDYARVDIRFSQDGIPYILEVNANPGIGPEDGFVRSAKAAGYTYTQLLEKLIDIALQRFNHS